MVDLKRLKNHYANYEPMLKMMRGKYETAMKARPPPPPPLRTAHVVARPQHAAPRPLLTPRSPRPPLFGFRRRC